jgi:hypothetical protein
MKSIEKAGSGQDLCHKRAIKATPETNFKLTNYSFSFFGHFQRTRLAQSDMDGLKWNTQP